MKNSHHKATLFFIKAGCFLPFLMILNLFFGWLFFPVFYWFIAELALIFLFIISMYFLKRIIFTSTQERNGVIDTEGKVVK
ncbi:MAG: hypothetical protein JW788_04245 [Candidatus Omnitrophica bacterium]|nr:hypothetical protein [Candidatus Omnitrophota bacterium]